MCVRKSIISQHRYSRADAKKKNTEIASMFPGDLRVSVVIFITSRDPALENGSQLQRKNDSDCHSPSPPQGGRWVVGPIMLRKTKKPAAFSL
jgi:hypothetical protein